MPKKNAEPPEVLFADRTKHILSGVVQSRSNPERMYYPRVMLSANLMDTCEGSQLRDSVCVHLRALLESMPKEELVGLILDAQDMPAPIVPET